MVKDDKVADEISLLATIQRKQEQLPAYVEIPVSTIAAWTLTETTTVLAAVGNSPPARRSLKRWDDARWFIDLPRTLLDAADLSVGDRTTVSLTLAPTDLPEELQEILASNPKAATRWERMSASQRRSLREHVLAAVKSETRRRRVERILCG